VANLARRANLEEELAELNARGMPIVVIWADQDEALPRLSFEALSAAAGGESITVPGGHCWLLADPTAFGMVMTNLPSG
jgi:pimeloyl-ACP methyl ester carboxylesterase